MHPALLGNLGGILTSENDELARQADAMTGLRLRPELYVGGRNAEGANQLALELIANSIDQFLAKRASTLWVTVEGNQLTVEDDGPGYPLDEGRYRSYLTIPHFSPTADRHAPHIHLRPSGVGIFVCNGLSSNFSVESCRGGRLSFARGRQVAHNPCERERGTKIQLTLDSEIFAETTFSLGALRRFLFQAVHLVGGLKVHLNQEIYWAPNGMLDLLELENYEFVSDKFHFVGECPRFRLECACLGQRPAGHELRLQSWVNGLRVPEHGSHSQGVLAALEQRGWNPQIVLVHAVMSEPQYAGPRKFRLQLPEIVPTVVDMLRAPLANFSLSQSQPDL